MAQFGFYLAYESLGSLLARARRSTGAATVVYHTPPGQTTMPPNPDHTSGSDVSSSSTESKPEPYVNKFAIQFLESAFVTVSEWVQQLEWADPRAQAHLSSQ